MGNKNVIVATTPSHNGKKDSQKEAVMQVLKDEITERFGDVIQDTEPKKEEPQLPTTAPVKSTQAILDKAKNISKCIEKLNYLNIKAKELDSFSLGTSKLKDSLQIADGNGNEFETSNVQVIDKVISLLKMEIGIKYTEVEAELHQLEAA